MLHRTRQLLVRQRTMLSNALRGHLAELGIVSAKGRNGTAELLEFIADGADSRVSPAVRRILEVLAGEGAREQPKAISSPTGTKMAAYAGDPGA